MSEDSDHRVRVRAVVKRTLDTADRRNDLADVKEKIVDAGFRLQRLPNGYSKIAWLLKSEEEREKMIGTKILAVSLRPYAEVPTGSIAKVLGYWDEDICTIEVEWLSARKFNGNPIIDGFSPGDFLEGMRVMTQRESKLLVSSLKAVGRE